MIPGNRCYMIMEIIRRTHKLLNTVRDLVMTTCYYYFYKEISFNICSAENYQENKCIKIRILSTPDEHLLYSKN